MIDPNYLAALSQYSSLISPVKSLSSAELHAFISEVADQEFTAAQRAMADSAISSDPRREIAMAIQSIRQALEKYTVLAHPRLGTEIGRSLVMIGSFGLVADRTDEWATKAIKSASALALLYASEHDKNLAERYTEMAFEGYRALVGKIIELNLPRYDKEGNSTRRDAERERRRGLHAPLEDRFRRIHIDMLKRAFPEERFPRIG